MQLIYCFNHKKIMITLGQYSTVKRLLVIVNCPAWTFIVGNLSVHKAKKKFYFDFFSLLVDDSHLAQN